MDPANPRKFIQVPVLARGDEAHGDTLVGITAIAAVPVLVLPSLEMLTPHKSSASLVLADEPTWEFQGVDAAARMGLARVADRRLSKGALGIELAPQLTKALYQIITESRLVDRAHLFRKMPKLEPRDDDSVAHKVDERTGAERGDEWALAGLTVGPAELGRLAPVFASFGHGSARLPAAERPALDPEQRRQ
ncbi:MAG: hypothetical protein DYG91_14735 [Chloroflexi bacterium CFX7]|nr:hypothetical protein [Chloroflexi bacterium CFX7]